MTDHPKPQNLPQFSLKYLEIQKTHHPEFLNPPPLKLDRADYLMIKPVVQLSGRLNSYGPLSIKLRCVSCQISSGKTQQCLLHATSARQSGHRWVCAITKVATFLALSGMQSGAHGELPNPRSGPVRHVCDVQARPLRHPRGAQWRRKRGPSAVQEVDPSWQWLEAQSKILQAVRVDWWLVSRRLHEGHHPVDSG